MSRDSFYKCTICGRYISYKDIEEDKVGRFYQPDTPYTQERDEIWHLECEKRRKYELLANSKM